MTALELVISRDELSALPEYSCSIPTGTTIGKRWRRDVQFNTPRAKGQTIEPEWMIGEYYELPESERYDRFDNAQVGIRWYWALEEPGKVHRGKL